MPVTGTALFAPNCDVCVQAFIVLVMRGMRLFGRMRIMIVTDAWFPQTNGVVSTLSQTVGWLTRFGHEVRIAHAARFPQHRLSDLS